MQQELSSHIYYDSQKRSLSTALDGFWKQICLKDRNRIDSYIQANAHNSHFPFEDMISGPNEGWLCVYGNTHGVSPYNIRDTTQSLGYVFWDSQRLRKAWFGGPMYVLEVCPVF